MRTCEILTDLDLKSSKSNYVQKPFQTWMISDLNLFENNPCRLLEMADQHKNSYQVFMLREKNLIEGERLSLVKRLRAVLKSHRLFLNWNGMDHVMHWPIDGLHLGVEVWKNPEILKLRLHRLGAMDLSLAIHSAEEWCLAKEMGYKPKVCILSPVFETSCKPQSKPLGITQAGLLAHEIHEDLPQCSVIAMGGITPSLSMDLIKLHFDGAAIRSGWMLEKTVTISK